MVFRLLGAAAACLLATADAKPRAVKPNFVGLSLLTGPHAPL
jgi:hypothetical protein